MSDWKKHLQELKFERLSKYFYDLNNEDLGFLSENELINMVEPNEKHIMKIFIGRFLRFYLNKHVSVYLNDPNDPNFFFDIKKKNKLPGDYSESLLSIINQRSLFYDTNKITLKSLKGQLNGIKQLNLSKNFLSDNDTSIIAKLVEECKPEIVNISDNHIHGYDIHNAEDLEKNIFKILFNTSKYVNLVANPFCSVDKKNFFMKLKEEELKKLIWIPLEFVNTEKWKSLIPNQEFHSIIKNSHEDYYKNYLE